VVKSDEIVKTEFRAIFQKLSINFTLIMLCGLALIVNNPFSLQSAYSQSAETHHEYLYGCTQYVPMIHCDPIVNEFESYQVKGNYSKIFSVTREPEFITGKDGQAVQVSASALEFISIENSSQFANNAFTIYGSFNLDVAENSVGSLVSYTNSPKNAGWSIDVGPTEDPTARLVKFSVFGNAGEQAEAEMTVPLYTFVDIAATFDGKTLVLYLNNALKSKVPFSGNYTANPGNNIPLKFAGGSYCSCSTLGVVLDDLRYYNRVFSPEELLSINATGDAGSVDRGLVGYWKFDGDIKDYAGFDNNGFYNTLMSNIAFSPDGRLFYTEKNSGKIRILDTMNKLLQQPFAVIPDIYVDWEQGLLGLAIDSKFTSNHFLYVYYNYKDEETGQIFARVVRFTESNNTATYSQIILDKIPAAKAFHTGGALAFNPLDEKLYVSVGDATAQEKAQNTSAFNGKILRINRDGSIPEDGNNGFSNPFVYTYGHRNVFGLAFDNIGDGIIAENGPTLYDEINFIKKGANYGWPTLQKPDHAAELFMNNSSVKPIRSYWQTPSPTQTVYYNHSKFTDISGSFIFGSVRGQLYSIKVDTANNGQLKEELKIDFSFYPFMPVVGIAASPNGDIYFGAYDLFKLTTIDTQNKDMMMHPIQINTTNSRLTELTFEKEHKNITASLDAEGIKNVGTNNTISIIMKIPRSMIDSLSFETSGIKNNTSQTSEIEPQVKATVEDNYNIVTIILPHIEKEKIQLVLSQNAVSIK
jgi:glucose/arabinose dehydrogenase